VLSNILASEFTVLTRLLARIAAGHYSTRDYAPDRLRTALESYVIHFPVYRTYITSSGPSPDDRAVIEKTIAKARAEWFGSDADIFDFLRDALTLDLVAPGRTGHSIRRVRRFAFKAQQFTGPMMAKSMEDTAFYRYHRLLALNEVGGDPASGAIPLQEFHAQLEARAQTLPYGMTATATHDTKRGEDARMRIVALSEMPDDWSEAVRHWRGLNEDHATRTDGLRAPSRAHEYMLYQALLGSWAAGEIGKDFVGRMQAYAVKAAREGKEQTNWLAPNEEYEKGLTDFLARILDHSNSAFLDSFELIARRAAMMGALNSLTQVTLKAAMPGVPDFYQGTEFWDLSLVDPDNRRPVDFDARRATLAELGDNPDWEALARDWQSGRIKFALTRQLLAIRNRFQHVFSNGSYQPLEVTGQHADEIVAFARSSGRDTIVVAAGRLFGRATDQGRAWPSADAWANASVTIGGYSTIRPLLGPIVPTQETQLTGAQLFGRLPVAILHAEFVKARKPRVLVAAH
jgi:(1->4)-alpha-D-glucan 1-alpha-D-glucosylmutase